MESIFRFLLVSFLFISCQQNIKHEDITKINGYWEIEKVVFEDGKDKAYTINESYDYFYIDRDNFGFRKKVMPQLDGSFIVNDSYENLKVKFEKDRVLFYYKTAYAKWSEELIEITDDKMVFVNAQKKEYHYKKVSPINIIGDGKKTK